MVSRSLVLAVVALCAFAAVADAARPHVIAKPTGLSNEAAFRDFMTKFDKKYDSADEYAKRLSIFAENLVLAANRQLQDPDAVHGVTQFSDLTPSEFRQYYLGVSVDTASLKEKPRMERLPVDALPATFDWRAQGAVTPVKNQGQCGSCWTFSTTGGIEGATFIKTGKLVSLSEQQLVDCDHNCDPTDPQSCDAGCNGGLMSNAAQYVMEHGSIDSEASYPYEGTDGTCRADKGQPAAMVSNWTLVDPDEDQMAAVLVANGPLSIGINAEWMQSYVGGVSCPYICSPKQLDHGVLIVGYGVGGISPSRLSKKDYWIIKNSWGASWGERGYINVCKGMGMCGLNEMVVSIKA